MEVNFEKQTHESKREYAGFWVRFAAYLLDSIIVGIPLVILTFLIFFILLGSSGALDVLLADPAYMEQEMTDQQAMTLIFGYLIVIAVNLILTVLYFAGFHSSKWQATPGKKLLSLTVTDLQGNRISFWRGFGRYLAMVFLSAILMIGYIMAAFTEKKQALHDMIAGTIVIKR